MFPPSAISTSQPALAMLARTPWIREPVENGSEWESGLASTGTVMHFAQDQEIYGEGDDALTFFKVVSGVVRTCKFLADGRRQIDSFHIVGDVFGVEADAEHAFCAQAVCDCTVVAYRRRGLETAASTDADLSRHLFSHAMRTLSRAQDHALLLGRKSAIEKVAAFLVEWAAHSPGAVIVSLAMTRQDIADYLGLTIETVSRTLSHLERAAIIELSSARQIRLKDPAALRVLNS
ncbi:helix-turn-helix domain-containing protein [Acidisphaera sp. S103]|uniref:helix-turn-helix domain-containing protein n=1 Tax=Acidisphaera sp. S103 TaxID=1747223 RepID=UPI00131A69F6|nr:helix-turn-helix domain-containing protein [Acidisphaera sp. S103]